MSRWAAPKADVWRIRILDVKMGRPKGAQLENQDPGCHDGPPQRRMAGESGSWMSRWAVPKADGLRIRILMSRWAVPKGDGLRIRILDVTMGRPKGGRLENQDPGCQDGPSQRRTA